MLQELEAVDAHGADALVCGRAHRCGNLRRMVHGAISVVPGRVCLSHLANC
jgi:hypothetical protein